MKIVIAGLSITSSWGNGHATVFRALVKQLARAGHQVIFLERDQLWYREQRDQTLSPHCHVILYNSLKELEEYRRLVSASDAAIVGSYVTEGDAVSRWVQEVAGGVTMFYDIDTPITVAALERGDCAYLQSETIPGFDAYLSFTGGPMLGHLRVRYGAKRAWPLYCCVDEEAYYPEPRGRRWDLGYLGTYSDDRQPALDRLLLEPARRLPERSFIVAGPQYPPQIAWPANVQRVEHLPPAEHRAFYNRQRLTLNLTRAQMRRVGYAPSVRLFEAAACGVAIISDRWPGIETFFTPGEEILLADDTEAVTAVIEDRRSRRLRRIGEAARQRVLAEHTAHQRCLQLLRYIGEARGTPASALAC